MSEPNNQSNELSLDQLDGINGGTIEKIMFSAGGRNRLHRGGIYKLEEGGMTTKTGTKRKDRRGIR